MLGPFLCGLVAQAPLLPKLRGHFAEFLNNASPAGLGILSPPTCVGLRYGRSMNNSGFSWRHGFMGFATYSSLPVAPWERPGVFPPGLCPHRLGRSLQSRPPLSSRVPTVLSCCGAGISTCCPSATAPALALGPDLPRVDQLHPGNLGYSAERIPTSLSLLIPAFSLRSAPPPLSVRLRRAADAPLPTTSVVPKLRRRVSAPVIFGAGALG